MRRSGLWYPANFPGGLKWLRLSRPEYIYPMSETVQPYRLQYDERRYYLYSHVKCEALTVEIAREYLREVVAECRELQYKRLLIESDLPRTLPVSKLKFLVSELAAVERERIRIAFVNIHPTNRRQAKRRVLTPENERIHAAAFATIPDARFWLMRD